MMRTRFIRDLVIVAVTLLIVGVAGEVARADDGYRLITTHDLKNWLESATPPTLIYSLSLLEYEEERIHGSICIPMELMQESHALPKGKNQPLVFYCKGPG